MGLLNIIQNYAVKKLAEKKPPKIQLAPPAEERPFGMGATAIRPTPIGKPGGVLKPETVARSEQVTVERLAQGLDKEIRDLEKQFYSVWKTEATNGSAHLPRCLCTRSFKRCQANYGGQHINGSVCWSGGKRTNRRSDENLQFHRISGSVW